MLLLRRCCTSGDLGIWQVQIGTFGCRRLGLSEQSLIILSTKSVRQSMKLSAGLVVMFRYWSLIFDLLNYREWIDSCVFYFSASYHFCKFMAELESCRNKAGYFPIDLCTIMLPYRRTQPSQLLWKVSFSPICSYERRGDTCVSVPSSLRREKVVSAIPLTPSKSFRGFRLCLTVT